MIYSQIPEFLTRALGHSEVVQRLGWTLLHSIWQGAAGALVLWIFLLMTRGQRAGKWSNIRYGAACAVMFAIVLASAGTFVRSMKSAPVVEQSSAVFHVISAPVESRSITRPNPIQPTQTKFDPHTLIPIAVFVWAIGVAIQSLWQCAGWLRLRRLRRGIVISDPIWIEILQQTSARLGIRRMVRLVVGSIDVPAVIGAFRPVIIIPLALLNELSPQQVQAVLAHELAHIRRWDYAVNLLQTAVETVFFYHPAIWWISSQIRRERENCCDDIAANLCGDRRRYAGTLIKLEERRADSPRLALAATDGSLIDRVRRLLAVPTPRAGRARSIFIALIGLICVLVPVAWQRTTHAQATQASAHAPSTLPSNVRRESPHHIIDVGDMILISIMDLQGTGTGEDLRIAPVSETGDIGLPYIKPVHAQGLTQQELLTAIVKAYQDAKIIRDPQVIITVDTRPTDNQAASIDETLRLAQLKIDAAQARLAQSTLTADQQAQLIQKDAELQSALVRLRDLENQLRERDAVKAATMPSTAPGDSKFSLDDLNLLNRVAEIDPVTKRLLADRLRITTQIRQYKLDGYGDGHAAVKAAKQMLADTENNMEQALADARAHPPAKKSFQYVHITVGKNGFISVDGGVGNWDSLRDRLARESDADRAKVVIAIAAETTDLPVGDFFLAQGMATQIVKEMGLAYVSVAGVETYTRAATRPDSIVYIGGAARRSGVYSIAGMHETISQLIIAAGGVTNGDDSHAWVTLIRRVDGARKEVVKDVPLFDIESGTSDLYLQPDDTVQISTAEPAPATKPK